LDYAEQTSSPHKLAGIAFVVVLHVAIIYALLSGLGSAVVQVFHAPLKAQIIQEVKPPPEVPPPPPPPVINPPPPYIPPPLVQIAPPPAPPVIATVTTQRPPVPVPMPVARPAVSRAAGLDPNQSCASTDSLQDLIGGMEDDNPGMKTPLPTKMQLLIATDGSVEKVLLASSSGQAKLDTAAQQALSQCKFRPALGADGKPQEGWAVINYVWSLN
jgi:protein TonB